MNKLTTVFCFCFFTLGLFAQDKKNIKDADKKFENFAYIDAREIYLDVVASGYKSENIYKKLGDSYYFNNELSKALVWYEKLYEYKKNLESIYLFRYAMSLKSVKRYPEADKILDQYNNSLTGSDSLTNIEKQSIEELMRINTGKFEIKRTTINSSFSDYAPSYYLSNIAFVSNRVTKEKPKQINHQWNNQPFSDLYYVNLKKNNELDTDIKPFEDAINSPYHESSCVFTKDGKTMYFSRNNYTDNVFKTDAKGINLIKIYKSVKNEKDEWQTPIELSFNSNEYSCAHPALSVDEKKLFFSSDMPGTKGLSDIFMSEIYEDGTYGSPVSLEGKINTSGRESYPFISAKNELFFASDGHYGLGGLDVFVTELDKNFVPKEIINLGTPLNGPTDDFSLIIDTKDNTGFFASNRDDGAGYDDIYSFVVNGDIITSCKQHVTGNISDEITNLPIKNANVIALDTDFKEIEKATTDENGNYSLDLDCNKQFLIRVSGDGIVTFEDVINTGSGFETKINKDFKVKEGQDLKKAKVKYGDDLNKILQLEPIYFDFDKSTIRPDAEVELQKIISFLNKNQNPSLDIRSHTDSQGERNYNLNLSERRAQATIDYIVRKGVSADRITGKGYGDTQLINKCSHGVLCSEAQHQLNRRSEFILYNSNNKKIISSTENTPNNIENKKETNPIVIENLVNEVVKTESKPQTKISALSKEYDFSSNLSVYTIQLAALKNANSNNFDTVQNVFKHTYADGLTRYFSGVFNTYLEAQNYRQEFFGNDVDLGFIVVLKGEKIVRSQ